MPEDLVYLSMIESGFNPTARSRAQAVGLWQFMAGTARDYGLRVDGYVDERRDPEKSTDAALRYLQDLHRQFGSWNLAAAAYNSGENRVARIMREETGRERGVEADFWRIRAPPAARHARVRAAHLRRRAGRQGAAEVRARRRGALAAPAHRHRRGARRHRAGLRRRAVGADEKDLRRLNPQLVRGVTPPGGESFAVAVPGGGAARFAAAKPRPAFRAPAAVR